MTGIRLQGGPRCWVRRHDWQQHPVFELPVRQCERCLRVETKVFGWGHWWHVKHLSGLSEVETRVRLWRRNLARELNEQLQRRGDPRAIW